MANLRHRSHQNHSHDTKNPRVEEITTSDEEAITAEASSELAKPKASRKRASIPALTEENTSSSAIGIVDIFRFITLFCLFSCLVYYYATEDSMLWRSRPWFTKWPVMKRYLQGPLVLTPAQLALYNGSDPNLPIYLAINGTIFDVSAKPHIYGPGGWYAQLAGADATRGYVTGCFAEDRTPDLRGAEVAYMPIEDADADADDDGPWKALTASQKKARQRMELRAAKAAVRQTVEGWVKFYKDNDAYLEVGKVIDSPGPEGEGLEPRKLCDVAEQRRPKRSELNRREKEKAAVGAQEKEG